MNIEMEEAFKRIMEAIRQEYEAGTISYIVAIQQIQKWCNMSSIEAETAVSDWEAPE